MPPAVRVRQIRVQLAKRVRGWSEEIHGNEPTIGLTGEIDAERTPHPGCVIVRFEAVDLGYDLDDHPDRRYRYYNIPIDCLVSLPEDDISQAKAFYENRIVAGDSGVESAKATHGFLVEKGWPPKSAFRVAKAILSHRAPRPHGKRPPGKDASDDKSDEIKRVMKSTDIMAIYEEIKKLLNGAPPAV